MNIVSNHNRLLRGAAIPTAGGDVYNSGWEYTPEGEISGYSGSAIYTGEGCPCDSAAIVDSAFNKSTAWVDEQNYLTAHQDVTNLPYVQNSALEFSPQGLISGISGTGFYAASAEGAFIAETANFAYNAEHADSADYAENVYSAQFANSASSALNAEVANVAYTALTAQFLDGGWEHDEDGFITAYNNSAFAGGGGRYEGIEPIVVNNEEMKISAKSALLGVQDPLYFVEDSETATVIGIHDSAFPTFEGTPDGKISAINGSALNADPVIDYSAGNNIDITDHVISVTGSVPSADRASYAVSATSSHFSHSAIEAGSAGSATYDNLGREITATYLTAVTGDNTPYSAGPNIDITDHVVSGKDWTSEIQDASANAVTEATNTITAVEFANSASALTTSAGWDVTEYTAGPNIVINNHIIGLDTAVELTDITGNRGTILDPSGLYVSDLDQSDYTEIGLDHVVSTDGSARIGWQLGNKEITVNVDSGNGDYAILHMSTADVLLEQRHQDPTPDAVYSLTGACQSAISAINMINSGDNQAYSAGQNIDITDHIVSGKDWTSEIQSASSYAYDQATGVIPTGIMITSALEYDGDNYITGYSGSAFAGQGGIEYEGIAPIVVNNLEHKISAQSAKLGVQSPLYFVEDSVSATIIGISGLPEGQDIMYESALGLSAGTITSYNNSAFGGGVQSDWTETATTNLAYIKHKPSEYNLVAGQNVTLTLAGNDLTIDAIGGGSTISYTTGSI